MALAMVACGGKNKQQTESAGSEATASVLAKQDPSMVYVYYFHGKQRCKTCSAVEEVSRKYIETTYGKNPKVQFVEVKTDEEASKKLVEKYEVTWNSLIIAKGEDHIEITKQAFAHAVNTPEKLQELLKTEVDKRIR